MYTIFFLWRLLVTGSTKRLWETSNSMLLQKGFRLIVERVFLLCSCSCSSQFSQCGAGHSCSLSHLVVISYKKLINIFLKQTKQNKSHSFKKDFTSLWSAFSQCGAGQSCSSVISLLLISHFKHKDNRFYYAFTTTVWTEALHCLMFPNVTYVFVSFFLCLMIIPWLVTVTKKSLSTWSLQCKIVK